MRTTGLLLFAIAVALATLRCSVDPGPAAPGSTVPGRFTLVVHSPNGPEGAAILDVAGGAVTGVTGDPAAVWVVPAGSRLRIAIVRAVPGELSATVAVSDTAVRLDPRLVQVAGPSNELRASLATYTIEVVR